MNRSSLFASALLAALPLGLVVSGCGGGSSGPNPAATPTATNIATETASPTATPIGTGLPTGPVRETYINVAASRIIEGNSGRKMMSFVVSAYDTYGEHFPLAFSYKTIDGTAVAGQDYIATSGTSSVTTGYTTTVSVPIIGDTVVEEDETFTLRVEAFARYSIVENTGVILSDERPSPTPNTTPMRTATPIPGV